MLVAWDTLRSADLPARAVSRLPERPRIRRRADRAARRSPGVRRGLRLRQRQRRRATRPTISSPPRPRPKSGAAARALVASGDRDTFQLASEHDHHPLSGPRRRDGAHRPGRGARALRRRSRAGAGLHRAARRSVRQAAGRAGRRRHRARPTLLRKYGTLEAALKAGRFATQAEDLRLFRSIATMDRKAPLPRLRDQKPTWARRPRLRGSGSSTNSPSGSTSWRVAAPSSSPPAPSP